MGKTQCRTVCGHIYRPSSGRRRKNRPSVLLSGSLFMGVHATCQNTAKCSPPSHFVWPVGAFTCVIIVHASEFLNIRN